MTVASVGDATLLFEGIDEASEISITENGVERKIATTQRRHSENPNDWRYWVVEMPKEAPFGHLTLLVRLEQASRLTRVELQCPWVLKAGAIVPYWPPSMINGWFESRNQYASSPRTPDILDHNVVDLIRHIDQRLELLPKHDDGIRRAVNTFFYLAAIPRRQSLYRLGLFTVLESVLTDRADREDSLRRQMASKMYLLNRRFDQPLVNSAFGPWQKDSPDEPFIQLWKALYGLRNQIEHGAPINFSSISKKMDDLRLLRDLPTATAYLETAVKAVLRFALIEPDLVSDLQRC